MSETHPTVTCVMAAFNYERYVEAAIMSVLTQDYPPELLDVVIVDDGSTDATAEVIRELAATAPGRVTLLQQENTGEARANAAAIAHARGELLAKLDADDVWLPGKVAAQASIFHGRPGVSLVYGDVRVVDEDGRVIEPSFFTREGIPPRSGLILEDLAAWNFAPNSSLMFRARDVKPIPPRMPFADYWLGAIAASAGETEVITKPVADYRMHGANRGFGSTGDAYVRRLARELLGRRLVLAEVHRSLRLEALLSIVNELLAKAVWTASLGSLTLAEVLDVQQDEREQAASALDRARHASDREQRLRLAALAVILDPLGEEARTALAAAAEHKSAAEHQPATEHKPAAEQADVGPIARISVDDSTQPRVSVIVPAFNLARYLPAALDSALGQIDPGGPMEVIVVDDGSTDETPGVLRAFAGRIRPVRQENAGLVAAVNTGLRLARGEFIALLDADDEWPPDRLKRHLAALDAKPSLGLVHGDMEIIDAHGSVTHPSFFTREHVAVHNGRILGPLLAGNFISGGGSTFRSSLLPALYPIPPEAAYPDWWIAACIASVALIETVPGVANRYRQHGQNMSLGSTPADQPKIQSLELPWRRWMYAHLLDDDTIAVPHLLAALASFEFGLRTAAMLLPEGARGLLVPDRAAAASARAELPNPAPGAPRSRALLRALAADPFDEATAIDLGVALQLESQFPQPAPSPPLIELQARPTLIVGWLDELLADPALLTSFRDSHDDPDSTTLAILAPPDARLEPLVRMIDSDPSLSGPDYDITVIAAPATRPASLMLAHRASALLTRQGAPSVYGKIPRLELTEPLHTP